MIVFNAQSTTVVQEEDNEMKNKNNIKNRKNKNKNKKNKTKKNKKTRRTRTVRCKNSSEDDNNITLFNCQVRIPARKNPQTGTNQPLFLLALYMTSTLRTEAEPDFQTKPHSWLVSPRERLLVLFVIQTIDSRQKGFYLCPHYPNDEHMAPPFPAIPASR